MFAEDLMIGDWVNYRGIYNRVAPADFCRLEWIDKIRPIPLTAEILEKNGFKYDGGIFYCDNEDDNYQMDIHPKETNYTGKYTFIGIEKGCITLTELPITYVHELQHALKLCGIKKEIVL